MKDSSAVMAKSVVLTWRTQETGGREVCGGGLLRRHMPESDSPAGLLPRSSPAPL